MMPEYFFHIAIELLPGPNPLPFNQTGPLNLSQVFRVLKPFLHSTRLRSSRDSRFDAQARQTTYKPQPQTSSPTLFVRTIAEQVLPSSTSDHRIDCIRLDHIDMEQPGNEPQHGRHGKQEAEIEKGMGMPNSGVQTKGQWTMLQTNGEGQEWGIVHLYRDASETPGLYRENSSSKIAADLSDVGNGIPVPKSTPVIPLPPARDEDCTTLCILAVPSYLAPADFLAFVGQKTRDQVSHFRMIRTSRQNRYMVLMKFRNGKRAREWQADWNGKVFNGMEPETVHVVFVKSVEVMSTRTVLNDRVSSSQQSTKPELATTFPSLQDDPFQSSLVAPNAKPLPPRTPSLVELPTCPVCLERMDETTGLLTILCQHVFHCTCLEKWSGGGCPVCRYTHDDFSTRVVGGHKYKSKSRMTVDGYTNEYELCDELLECETCHSETSLWQCLICGKVGCGRYEGKHAYQHFDETGHTFSMDLESKRVWDYAGDVYVHRIIQDAGKTGEKLVELPGRRHETTALEETNDDVAVAKMENIAVEYTHLLTSQLESQRVYFEEIVERAVDKAAEACRQADRIKEESNNLQTQLQDHISERDEIHGAIHRLRMEKDGLEKRAAKFEEMSRGVNARYQEEKSLANSLMERIKHLEEKRLKSLEERIRALEEENATKDLLMEGLRDEHRDAMMQVSAQQKLTEMVASGELDPEDLIGATIEAGPVPIARRRKRTVQTAATKPTPIASTSDDDDELTILLTTKLGLNTGKMQKGHSWDDEKANQLLEELKEKMVAEGLLSDRDVGDGGSAAAKEESDKAKTRKKNKKGKGKS